MMGQDVDAGAFNLDGVTISFAEAMGLKRRIQVCSVQGPPKGDDKGETPRRFKEIGRFLGRLELSLRMHVVLLAPLVKWRGTISAREANLSRMS